MANVQSLELVGVWAAAVVLGLLLKQLAEQAQQAAAKVLVPVRKNDRRPPQER